MSLSVTRKISSFATLKVMMENFSTMFKMGMFLRLLLRIIALGFIYKTVSSCSLDIDKSLLGGDCKLSMRIFLFPIIPPKLDVFRLYRLPI
jgi:hypothetical protein